MTFLQERVQIWERSAKTQVAVPRTDNFQKRRDNQSKSTQRVRANPVNQQTHKTSGFKCPVCGAREFHYTSKCSAFLKKSTYPSAANISRRRTHAITVFLQIIGLVSANQKVLAGSVTSGTTLFYTLRTRKSTPAAKVKDEESDEKEDNSGSRKAVGTPAVLATQAATIFLCTVQIPCLDAYGGVTMLRAMLDTGSQVDIITADAAEKLGFDVQKSTLEIVGVGSARSQRALGRVDFSILLPDQKQYKVSCDVLNQVVGDLCIGRMPPKFLDKFKGYDLADPNFYRAKKIDVLLGMVHFPHLVLKDREQVDSMWLLHTVFGWAVTGQPTKTVRRKCPRRVQMSGPVTYSASGSVP